MQISLNRLWSVNQAGISEKYPASVPGDIHNDLMKAGVIKNPYFGMNSSECKWVTEKDWEFTKTFTVSELKKNTYLVFKGIDTVSEVFLNGDKILDTDNMFLKYRVDVTKKIKTGENTLTVKIKSIREVLNSYPTEDYFACFNTQRIFVRKAQCHFSWDWAPDFPTTGIWKDVYLKSYDDTLISDVKIVTDLLGNVTFFAHLDETTDKTKKREFILKLNNKMYTFPCAGKKSFTSVKIDNPKLWWPRNMGEANLYDYHLTLMCEGEVSDCKSGKFGIRTVELEEKPRYDEGGLTCQLKINGNPVFLKGANWVPLDIMTGCITDEKYKTAIQMAYDANFNMLRVWGGGIYENDILFDICDEMGILVWQDFAFACSDIPDNHPEFIDRVIPEIEYQITRLRNHPSLVIYSGGNEKTDAFCEQKHYGDRLIYYYLRGVCGHLDGTRPYFPSSPWGHGDIGNVQDSGDSHLNSYQTSMISPNNKNAVGIENFRDALKLFKASMFSEIAVQGAPPVSSLKKYIPSDKLWPLNEVYDLHFTRNPYDGTGTTFAQQQLFAAEKLFGDITDVYDFCKKSMTLHAEFVRADAEASKVRIGKCSCSMFWMYADTWPCGTWAIVDYYLKPKAAYYAAKRAFKPVSIIITKTVCGYDVFAVNDTNNNKFCSAKIGIMTLSGDLIKEISLNSDIGAYSSVKLYSFSDAKLNDNEFMFATMDLGSEKVETSMFTTVWKDILWPQPKLKYTVKKLSENKAKIILCTVNYARTVNILVKNNDDIFLSDNYFDMLPGSEKTILIKSKNPLFTEDLVVNTWLDKWEN